jgi:hypothetical protein
MSFKSPFAIKVIKAECRYAECRSATIGAENSAQVLFCSLFTVHALVMHERKNKLGLNFDEYKLNQNLLS